MQSQYRLHKTYKLLEAADRAFEGDETSREGARLMWEATVAGLSDIAKSRGWPHKTRDDIQMAARRLDRRKEGHDSPIISNPRFTVIPNPHFINHAIAEMFLEQSEWIEGEWERTEFRWDELDYQDMRKGLKKYLSMLEGLARRDSVVQ